MRSTILRRRKPVKTTNLEQVNENTDTGVVAKRRTDLQAKISLIAKSLGNDGKLLLQARVGRKPMTAYRTRAELIVAQTAPVAALIQAHMLRGEIPHDDSIFRCCDLVLDRVCGRARQSVIMTSDEGIARLERLADRIEALRTPQVVAGLTSPKLDPVSLDVIPSYVSEPST